MVCVLTTICTSCLQVSGEKKWTRLSCRQWAGKWNCTFKCGISFLLLLTLHDSQGSYIHDLVLASSFLSLPRPLFDGKYSSSLKWHLPKMKSRLKIWNEVMTSALRHIFFQHIKWAWGILNKERLRAWSKVLSYLSLQVNDPLKQPLLGRRLQLKLGFCADSIAANSIFQRASMPIIMHPKALLIISHFSLCTICNVFQSENM